MQTKMQHGIHLSDASWPPEETQVPPMFSTGVERGEKEVAGRNINQQMLCMPASWAVLCHRATLSLGSHVGRGKRSFGLSFACFGSIGHSGVPLFSINEPNPSGYNVGFGSKGLQQQRACMCLATSSAPVLVLPGDSGLNLEGERELTRSDRLGIED